MAPLLAMNATKLHPALAQQLAKSALAKNRSFSVPVKTRRSLLFKGLSNPLNAPHSPFSTPLSTQHHCYSTANPQPPSAHLDRPSRKINKLLIANRGEISVRIQHACHEMNIKTASIYSPEDESAFHCLTSFESYLLDPAKSMAGGRSGRGGSSGSSSSSAAESGGQASGRAEGSGRDSAAAKLPTRSAVQAYLDMQTILKIAKESKADAIHPGYGFLSENSLFAENVEKNNLMFVGPSSHTIAVMGDKVAARKIAVDAGVSVVPGSNVPVKSVEEAKEIANQIGYPVMLKAAYGGGGRGMRRVFSESELATSYERAYSEALNSFGNGALFVEKLIRGGYHIEVQIMGDLHGSLVHFFERDCSIQRKHQKIVEIAPAPFLDPKIRSRILEDAVKLMSFVGYQNAGTVEFLVDGDQHYFIEVNPRLQVEHTVTEEFCGVDLVKTQLAIAQGSSLEELGLTQDKINEHVYSKDGVRRGPIAIQCRVTTEDTQKNFRPSTGRIDLYQPPMGPGIRLDSAIGTSGAIIGPHFDSLLLKIISRGKDFSEAVTRSQRALKDTRIRGVTTNICYLLNVLGNETFKTGKATVHFLDDNPQLLRYNTSDSTSDKLCAFLAEVIVNGPKTDLVNPKAQPTRTAATVPDMSHVSKLTSGVIGVGSWAGPPEIYGDDSSPHHDPAHHVYGHRDVLKADMKVFLKSIREHKPLLITDTSMRDAHQSLLATRVRTLDMLKIAPFYSHEMHQLFSLETWGGATFDVAYRFLKECPWQRLVALRKLIPNIPFQMLLRGANAVGYSVYPDNAVEKFCAEAASHGIDIFRIFDALNYMDNLKLGIQAAGASGKVVQAAISYTGDVADKKRGPYTLEYYLKLANDLVAENIHMLCIKDMAGLLTSESASVLIGSLRKQFPDLPIHVHTHDTGGYGVSAMLAAAKAGADIVDLSVDSLSGLTSQPSMGAVVASLRNSENPTEINERALSQLSSYWEHVRGFYAPFDCTETLKAGNSDVYEHEIPGGQYTNLHMQAWSLGIADKWNDIKQAYKQANKLLGDPPKVTPSSKVVGDMAQFMVQNKLDMEAVKERASELSFPSSVVEYFEGKLGQHPFGFPEELQKAILRGRKPIAGRPGQHLPPVEWDKLKANLEAEFDREMKPTDLLSSVMYPDVFKQYMDFLRKFGDVSALPTAQFFTGMKPGEEITVDMAGREVRIKYITHSDMLGDGTRDVFFEVMGRPRKVNVLDSKASKDVVSMNVLADTSNPNQIAAPMPGSVLSYKVKEGDKVQVGDPLVVLTAMKMETVVVSPKDGMVVTVPLKEGSLVKAGDLLLNIE